MDDYIINDKNQIELEFSFKPNPDVIQYLRTQGWFWNSAKQRWIKRNRAKNIASAQTALQMFRNSLNSQQYDTELDYDTNVYVIDDISSHRFHYMVEQSARIKICDRFALLSVCVSPIFYCKTCSRYYILQDTYNNICAQGAPLASFYSSQNGFDFLREESPLKLLGYNVSQKEALSSSQRRDILQMIYDKKIMPKWKILSYLEWYIDSHQNEMFEIARMKWTDDMEYVKHFIK